MLENIFPQPGASAFVMWIYETVNNQKTKVFSFLPLVQFQLKAFDISVSKLLVELNYGQLIKELQAEAGYPQVEKE